MELSGEAFLPKVSRLFSQIVKAYADNVGDVAEAGFIPKMLIDPMDGIFKVVVYESAETMAKAEAEMVTLSSLNEAVKALESGLAEIKGMGLDKLVEVVKKANEDIQALKKKAGLP